MGLETFARVYAHSPTVPIIVLTGNDDQTVALSAVKGGAQDYLVKGGSTASCWCARCTTPSSASATRCSSSTRPTTTRSPGCRTAACCTTACARRCTRSACRAPSRWCSSTSTTSSSSTTAWATATGDELLKAMAERLRTVLREGDTVARLGGDEFVLILNDQSNEEIIFRAMQRISAKVSEPITIDGKELHVTCSAGISLLPAGRARRRHAAEERRRRDVPRQGARPQQLPVLHLGDERARERAPGAGERAAPRARAPGAHAALPAEGEPEERRRSSARRRWCAGCTRSGAWCARRASSRSPRRPASSCSIGEWVLREACRQTRAWIDAGLRPRRGLGQPLGAPVPPGRPGAHRVAHPGRDAASIRRSSRWSSPRAW